MRHFTPQEANAALGQGRPLVEGVGARPRRPGEAPERGRPLAEERAARGRAHVEALERKEELEARIRGNGGGIPPAELADAAAEVDRQARSLARAVDEIVELGLEVKDLDEGLVD